jgi:hypothetical protein
MNRLYGISDERQRDKAVFALTSRNAENDMLTELRDIRDELEIISLLQDDQMRVIRDMGTTIGRMEDQKYRIRYTRLQDEIDDQVVDVANLIKLAGRVSFDVSSFGGFRLAAADDIRSTELWILSRAPFLQMRHSTLSPLAANWQARAQGKEKSSCSSLL